MLENGNKENKHNISSLNKLNEILLVHKSKDFEDRYFDNKTLIETIKGSGFYDKIKKLRDKKFGHADNDEINKPFSIKGFRADDFENAYEHLRMIKVVFNNFGSVYGRTYDLDIPNRDNRTKKFIKFHAECQTYFMDNYVLASANPGKRKYGS